MARFELTGNNRKPRNRIAGFCLGFSLVATAAVAGPVTFTAQYNTPYHDCMVDFTGLQPSTAALGGGWAVQPFLANLASFGLGVVWSGCQFEYWRPSDMQPFMGLWPPSMPYGIVALSPITWGYFEVSPYALPGSDIKGLTLDWTTFSWQFGPMHYEIDFFGGVTVQPFDQDSPSTAFWTLYFGSPSSWLVWSPPSEKGMFDWTTFKLDKLAHAEDASQFPPSELDGPEEALEEAVALLQSLEMDGTAAELRNGVLLSLDETNLALSAARDVLTSLPPEPAPEEWEMARATTIGHLEALRAAHDRALAGLSELEALLRSPPE